VADNKKKRGKQDRAKIASQEPYEVAYVAKKLKVKPTKVKAVIKKVGTSRAKVNAVLKKGK
jgi:hypothetical protein